MRHGLAIDRADPACPTDPERFLTDKGKQKTGAAMRGAKVLGLGIDLVLCSPYVRAQQTADIAVAALGLRDVERVTTEALLPLQEPERLVEALRKRPFEAVLCVGHAPNLDRAAAHLAGSDGEVTHLKKAGLASLSMQSVSRGGGFLFAVYPPATLRKLGGE